MKVLDAPFTWRKTFTSYEAKCILNGDVVPVQSHPMPYILSLAWLIIYTALQMYAVLSEKGEGTLRAPKNTRCSTGKANKGRRRKDWIQPEMDRVGEVGDDGQGDRIRRGEGNYRTKWEIGTRTHQRGKTVKTLKVNKRALKQMQKEPRCH